MEKVKTPLSEWLQGNIFDDTPKTWRQLQDYVAQIFREVGYTQVNSPHKLTGVRGTKEFDVYAVDTFVVPPNKIACECKNWSARVSQDTVLGFRSVLEDNGINKGFIISKKGFQSGAYEAAKNTPIVLVDFIEFMDLFFGAWLKAMSLKLHEVTDALFPFFDIYWFEHFPELSKEQTARLFELREKYWVLFSPTKIWDKRPGSAPISIGIIARNPEIYAPLKHLGISTYRQFFNRLLAMADHALIDFCSVVDIEPKFPLQIGKVTVNMNS